MLLDITNIGQSRPEPLKKMPNHLSVQASKANTAAELRDALASSMKQLQMVQVGT